MWTLLGHKNQVRNWACVIGRGYGRDTTLWCLSYLDCCLSVFCTCLRSIVMNNDDHGYLYSKQTFECFSCKILKHLSVWIWTLTLCLVTQMEKKGKWWRKWKGRERERILDFFWSFGMMVGKEKRKVFIFIFLFSFVSKRMNKISSVWFYSYTHLKLILIFFN